LGLNPPMQKELLVGLKKAVEVLDRVEKEEPR